MQTKQQAKQAKAKAEEQDTIKKLEGQPGAKLVPGRRKYLDRRYTAMRIFDAYWAGVIDTACKSEIETHDMRRFTVGQCPDCGLHRDMKARTPVLERILEREGNDRVLTHRCTHCGFHETHDQYARRTLGCSKAVMDRARFPKPEPRDFVATRYDTSTSVSHNFVSAVQGLELPTEYELPLIVKAIVLRALSLDDAKQMLHQLDDSWWASVETDRELRPLSRWHEASRWTRPDEDALEAAQWEQRKQLVARAEAAAEAARLEVLRQG
jgi:predicted RNA-binding Zn-ribbon protein involved in translation (DUF1610 family)